MVIVPKRDDLMRPKIALLKFQNNINVVPIFFNNVFLVYLGARFILRFLMHFYNI